MLRQIFDCRHKVCCTLQPCGQNSHIDREGPSDWHLKFITVSAFETVWVDSILKSANTTLQTNNTCWRNLWLSPVEAEGGPQSAAPSGNKRRRRRHPEQLGQRDPAPSSASEWGATPQVTTAACHIHYRNACMYCLYEFRALPCIKYLSQIIPEVIRYYALTMIDRLT